MNYILDTNVVSELVSREPDQRVVQWLDCIDPTSVYLSVITIGEIRKGIQKLPDSGRKEELSAWLEKDLLMRFGDHILPIDNDVMLSWGIKTAELEKKGKPMPAIDSLLAAVASRWGFTLVTRNTADFSEAEIDVFNPWELER